MQIRFDGRVVLVTGAAQGIGRGIAEAFRDAGARVHLADRDEAGVAAAGAALGCPHHALDLSNRAAAGRLVAAITEREGRLDVLALAAGGVVGQGKVALDEITEESWSAVFRANVESALWVSQAAAPVMTRAGWGRIVIVTSGAGLRASMTGLHAYAAAKHAAVGLTRQLSVGLARDGVTVNSVAPGFLLTNPSTERQWDGYGPDGQRRVLDAIHTGRLGQPADIAAATLFLASEQAGWITGQILSVDGGRS